MAENNLLFQNSDVIEFLHSSIEDFNKFMIGLSGNQLANRHFVFTIEDKTGHPWESRIKKQTALAVNNLKGRTLLVVRNKRYFFTFIPHNEHLDVKPDDKDNYELFFTTDPIGSSAKPMSGTPKPIKEFKTVSFMIGNDFPKVFYYQCMNHEFVGGLVLVVNQNDSGQADKQKTDTKMDGKMDAKMDGKKDANLDTKKDVKQKKDEQITHTEKDKKHSEKDTAKDSKMEKKKNKHDTPDISKQSTLKKTDNDKKKDDKKKKKHDVNEECKPKKKSDRKNEDRKEDRKDDRKEDRKESEECKPKKKSDKKKEDRKEDRKEDKKKKTIDDKRVDKLELSDERSSLLKVLKDKERKQHKEQKKDDRKQDRNITPSPTEQLM
jgi:hypothetical protein